MDEQVQQLIQKESGYGFVAQGDSQADYTRMKDKVLEELKKRFKPEFLNRVDETVVFERLKEADMAGIVDIQLARLERRLADRKVSIDLSNTARLLIALKGFDPRFGARPLKRVVQNEIQNPLAKRILQGEVREGDCVMVDATDGAFSFSIRRNG